MFFLKKDDNDLFDNNVKERVNEFINASLLQVITLSIDHYIHCNCIGQAL